MGDSGRQKVAHLYQDAILKLFWDNGSAENARKRPATLYHYTSLETAMSILGDDDHCGFAFTHYRFLNDRDEYSAGLKIAKNLIDNESGNILGSAKGELLKLVDKGENDMSLCPYVLSFSTEQDSTPQWMAYTDKHSGGLAIGLDRALIEQTVRKVASARSDGFQLEDVVLAPCIYCDYKDKKLLDSFGNVLRAMFSNINFAYSQDTHDQFIRWCAARIFQFAALVKSNAFSSENEWRLVIRPVDFDYASDILFIGGKPRLKPPMLDLKHCVSQIVRSPHGNKDRIKITAKLLAMKLGCDVNVTKSKITYCGE